MDKGWAAALGRGAHVGMPASGAGVMALPIAPSRIDEKFSTAEGCVLACCARDAAMPRVALATDPSCLMPTMRSLMFENRAPMGRVAWD